MTRPLRGPLNATMVDHSTDAYDTIEWLVKNVPESHGKIGMLGSSYEGFTVVMALVNPHPALKVAAPMSPMVDGWMGDDWFHFGAFRQVNFDYFTDQTTVKGDGNPVVRETRDDYENFRGAGSAGDFARSAGLDQLPWWRKISEHPSYDMFWQAQALDKTMAAQPLKVPTMWIQGLWDQEDMWGAIHCYLATEPKDGDNSKNFLVMGPWRHSGVNYSGSTLGPLKWEGDTALQFRRDVLKPFFDQYLKDGAPMVKLVASTSGTDSDWVVKLIDVYLDEVTSQDEMSGYQLGIAMDIFRGRYRESFENPKALTPNVPLTYKFVLPHANHVFLPGHRVMVQIQSSWFPLYDRNPQTFVPNIFFAKSSDYVKATQRVYYTSFIDLPVVR